MNQVFSEVKKVQLTGEGRGRISVDSKRYLFDFGSLGESTKEFSSWILELDFALHGSEHLTFKWETKRWSAGGSFLGALRMFIRSSTNQVKINEKELNELLSFISEALRLTLRAKHDEEIPKCLISTVCPIPKRRMLLKWSSQNTQSLSVSSKSLLSKNNMTYSLIFSNMKADQYKQLSLQVRADQGFKRSKELLSLNLYFD